MKGKNWREYEPPKRRRRRRRKGGLLRKLRFAVVLFLVGYVGFLVYYNFGKPYTVALDAGHGGADVGAEGVDVGFLRRPAGAEAHGGVAFVDPLPDGEAVFAR